MILDLHDPMPELFRSIYPSTEKNRLARCLEILERFSTSFADLVLTPNVAFKELFVSRSCSPEKVEIIMNSPEDAIFKPTPRNAPPGLPSKPCFNLMYHGLLAERSGADLAVKAVARLRKRIPQLRLHLYGDATEYLRAVLQLAHQLDVDDVVKYHGYNAGDC